MPTDDAVQEFRHRRFMEEGVRTVNGDAGMQARVRAVGSTLLIHATGARSEFTRKPLEPGVDQIDITMVDRGEYSYLDEGGWRIVTDTLMIAPSGMPHRVQFSREWAMTVVRIPRELLIAYAPGLRAEIQLFAELSPFETSVGAFARQMIYDERATSASEASATERVLREMIGTLVQQRAGNAGSTTAAAVWDRTLSVIRAHAGDPSLTPAQIAHEVGCSLRYLQASLNRNGTSISAEIRRERTRRARDLLRDSAATSLSVDEIARFCGFGSSSSLRRALDEIYDRTPREMRQLS